LIGGLFGNPGVHGEARSFGRAARIFAVTGCAVVGEQLLGE